MVLNADKTKSILLSGKKIATLFRQIYFRFANKWTKIEQVTSHKLLGVIIDEELRFKEHLEKLCKKLSERIGLLKKIRSYLPIQERKLYYNALVKPTMYGGLVWTYCSTTKTCSSYDTSSGYKIKNGK